MTENAPPPQARHPTTLRDSMCGAITAEWIGRRARLSGWVHRRRDLGAVVFVELRDRSGIVQLAFGPDWTPPDVLEAAAGLKSEDVVAVGGEVNARPPEAINPDVPTGAIELRATELRRLAVADPLPIQVAIPPDDELPAEELRLRYRYLDLRRPQMMRHFEIRHRATAAARAALSAEGFLEIETPLLTRPTPEGARDYVVPSRIHRGEFYALPQSPQLYKQLLMAAGFDRYFQIARCLRDEDLRADRQPEFTQVDGEMSFVEEDDVFGVVERMLARMWSEAVGVEAPLPFPRLTWAEAVERYGSDKPDLRVSWEIRDFTDLLRGIGFGIFDTAVAAGGRIRGFVATGGGSLSRARLDVLDEAARAAGARGMLWTKRTATGWSGGPARYLTEATGNRLRDEFGVVEGDLLVMVAGPDAETTPALGALRLTTAAELGALDPGAHHWLWVTEFPLFEADPDTGEPVPSHHPFTMPAVTDLDLLRERPLAVKARAYDVVYNGSEICSGSIRVHDPRLQEAILAVLGFSAREARERFGFLLEAFRYGTPPHGGFAVGLDRVVTRMLGAASLREVIAFPKTTAARGLMEGTPAPLEATELDVFGLQRRSS